MTGYSREEAIGQLTTLLRGEHTDQNIVEISEYHLQTGQSHEYSLLHYRKSKSTYQCAITRAPLVDLDGTSE